MCSELTERADPQPSRSIPKPSRQHQSLTFGYLTVQAHLVAACVRVEVERSQMVLHGAIFHVTGVGMHIPEAEARLDHEQLPERCHAPDVHSRIHLKCAGDVQLQDDGAHIFDHRGCARCDVDKCLPLAAFAVDLQQLDWPRAVSEPRN
eukprot:5315569-Prymnesium_polylepis.1